MGSMSMRLQVAVTQALAIVGGATESIFPQVEALLSTTDYAFALEYVSGRKNIYRYRSFVDFLFCELHTEWRLTCFRFYMGGETGVQLKDIITPEQLFEFNRRMLIALELAEKHLTEKRKQNWGWFREEVYEEAAKAS